MKKLFLVLTVLLGVGCTSEDRSLEVLQNEGYTEIVLTGYDYWSCDEYTFRTGFEAINPRGRHVQGTVCCSFLTDCSIHW